MKAQDIIDTCDMTLAERSLNQYHKGYSEGFEQGEKSMLQRFREYLK